MPMDARDIEKLVAKAKDDIIKEVNDRLPRKVGVTAVNHFKQNFRDGGWLDNGLHPWKRTRRQEGTGTNARRGPLLSGREHLMKSIQASTSPGQVSIENPVPYAHVHNDGAKIPVTKKMKKYAWFKFYSLSGFKKGQKKGNVSPEAEGWKGLALTKKSSIIIPQRQFMGDSAELRVKVNKLINESIQKIKDGIIALSSH